MSLIVKAMVEEFEKQADDRDAILRGAAELLREGQLPLTRLKIAMRSGVSPKSISKNFRSLSALKAEVHRRNLFGE